MGVVREQPGRATPRETIGAYRLLRVLGEGGMGVVHLARDERLRRLVALKLLRPERVGSRGSIERFQREAHAIARLRHPSIVTLYEAGEADGECYLAMEWVPGRGLDEVLRERRASEGAALDPREALRWTADVARALAVAHAAGVVHRDVKPSNLRIEEGGSAKLLDFGLAKLEGDGTLTRAGSFQGSPAYAAPEQVSATFGEVDAQTDVYGLGATLYECVTGRAPFSGETTDRILHEIVTREPSAPRSVRPEVSRDLEAVVQKALEKDRRHRYASADAFAADLSALLEGRPVQARPVSSLGRLERWVRRNPALGAAAGFGVLALVVAPSVILWRERDARLALQEEQLRTEAKAAALAQSLEEIGRLSDSKRLDELLAEEKDLWPVGEDLVTRAEDWLARASTLKGRRAIHEETLAKWDRAAAEGADPAAVAPDEWQRDVLREVLRKLERIDVVAGTVEKRRKLSSQIVPKTITSEAARTAWERARESIAAEPVYGGLDLAPQPGLLPLWQDPRSRLWEFLHIATGGLPEVDHAKGSVQVIEPTGVVLVLVPGGRATIGTRAPGQGAAEGAPFVDPEKQAHELDLEEVDLDPFFLSKYELSQAQWKRFADAGSYSFYVPAGGGGATPTSPADNLSADLAERMLARVGLILPTEAQWEVACRAGGTSVYATGNDPKSLQGHANVYDLHARTRGGQLSWAASNEIDDGFIFLSPVGSFAANPWGFHDMHGNVREWCRDALTRSGQGPPPRAGDGLREQKQKGGTTAPCRGGSYKETAAAARVAHRSFQIRADPSPIVGVRPARTVER